ncbi:MAG: hypothetical protein Q4F75_03040 [Pseudomonadota bacterium]|nr:hypothetical protein [Pseudomonadota bacterium]
MASSTLLEFPIKTNPPLKGGFVFIGDPNGIGLFALLSAPLRPRSAKASPAYFRLPLVLVKPILMGSNQIKISNKQ